MSVGDLLHQASHPGTPDELPALERFTRLRCLGSHLRDAAHGPGFAGFDLVLER